VVSYGLNIGQVEQQLASNNVNAGGSFIQEVLQQVNVRALGLVTSVRDIFLLPTLYVWIARGGDVLPASEREFDEGA
jgi:Cu/Ag efflux pump CusA